MRRLVAATFCFGLAFFGSLLAGEIAMFAGFAPDSHAFRFALYGLHMLPWLGGSYFSIVALDHFFWEGYVARKTGRPVPPLLRDVAGFLILLLAVTGIIGYVFDSSVTGIWATSGMLGVVLGFALRNLILDAFTGIALNLDRSFRQGDWVEISQRDRSKPYFGRILEINWRAVRIQLEENNVVVVPNSMIGMVAVTNLTQPEPLSRFELPISLDFQVPRERATRILMAGVRAAIGPDGPVAEPEPRVLVADVAEVGVEYRVRYWLRVGASSPSTVKDRVLRHVLNHLHKAGLQPAHEREDVYFAQMPERHLDHQSHAHRIHLLSRIELFERTLGELELTRLAEGMPLRRFSPGEQLIREGDAGESMFIVAEGLVEVFARRPGLEEDVRVGHVGPGEFFGEMSLLTGEPRSASVIAATEVIAYEIASEDVSQLLAQRPEIAAQISEVIAERRLGVKLALSTRKEQERSTESARLSAQILQKMKSFFSNAFDTKRARQRHESDTTGAVPPPEHSHAESLRVAAD